MTSIESYQLTADEIQYLLSLPELERRTWLDNVAQQDLRAAAAFRSQLQQPLDFGEHLEPTDTHPNSNTSPYKATRAQAAQFFGVSVGTISDWRRAGMPYRHVSDHEASQYDLQACAQWLVKKRQPDTATESSELQEAALREKQEAARIKELKRLHLENRLVDREDYRSSLVEVCQHLKNGARKLQARHGEAVYQDFNTEIEQAEKELVRKFTAVDAERERKTASINQI